ncbi:hypothetical protein Lalb_Chr14g0369421 [Lupinus albus]|uniref:Uncharacterized protein n=1 Tax=Lupinus albus TaxID=3870 RepID=A0A6A4P2I2_LUPAL|nr:hypothetical protein Lalb_Chr14g0369421 [Lupinus albus]
MIVPCFKLLKLCVVVFVNWYVMIISIRIDGLKLPLTYSNASLTDTTFASIDLQESMHE